MKKVERSLAHFSPSIGAFGCVFTCKQKKKSLPSVEGTFLGVRTTPEDKKNFPEPLAHEKNKIYTHFCY